MLNAHQRKQDCLKLAFFPLSFDITAWKVSKYGVISGPYFPGLNTGKYGPEITPYFDTFDPVYGDWYPSKQIEQQKEKIS